MSSDMIVDCFGGFYLSLTVLIFVIDRKDIKESYRKLNEHLDQKEKEKNAADTHVHSQ